MTTLSKWFALSEITLRSEVRQLAHVKDELDCLKTEVQQLRQVQNDMTQKV